MGLFQVLALRRALNVPQPWFQGLPALLSHVWAFSRGLEKLLGAGFSLETGISSGISSGNAFCRVLELPRRAGQR